MLINCIIITERHLLFHCVSFSLSGYPLEVNISMNCIQLPCFFWLISQNTIPFRFLFEIFLNLFLYQCSNASFLHMRKYRYIFLHNCDLSPKQEIVFHFLYMYVFVQFSIDFQSRLCNAHIALSQHHIELSINKNMS